MANRYWVGGTGTFEDTAHWAAATGGAGGQSVPGVADAATFDAASGGGVVTPSGAAISVLSITMGAFTGTWAGNTNNPNVTVSNATGFSITGSGTRTINLGNGIYDLTATVTGTLFNAATVTGLTFNANGSTIRFSGTCTALRSISGGGLTFNNIDVAANPGLGGVGIVGSNTIAGALTMAPGSVVTFGNLTTTTFSAAQTWAGSSSDFINIIANGTATLVRASGTMLLSYARIRGLLATGGATYTATETEDLGANTGWSISPPTGGGGAGGVNGIIGLTGGMA